jgi:hypothetical protein
MNMNIYKKLFAVILLGACFMVFGANTTEAGTYKFGGIVFTATHCNSLGICHDPSQGEAVQVLKYALAKGKKTYVHSMACGNTVKLVIKSCSVINKCDNGVSIKRDVNCKTTKTTCNCGCANGSCENCPGEKCPDGSPKPPSGVCDPGGGGGCTGSNCGGGDPGSCTEDIWECGAWGTCTNGMQNRSCTMVFNCPDASTPTPLESRTCVGDGEPPACTYPAPDGSCPPPDIQLSAIPSLISEGQSCKVIWKVSGAESCTLDGDDVSPTSGNKSVSPKETTNYKLTCVNGPSSATKAVDCRVLKVDER